MQLQKPTANRTRDRNLLSASRALYQNLPAVRKESKERWHESVEPGVIAETSNSICGNLGMDQ
jgi:hypothetical protein